MSVKKIYYLILLCVNFIYSQNRELHLKFTQGDSCRCSYSFYRDGKEARIINYVDTFEEGNFMVCNQFFKIIPNSIVKGIDRNEIKKINFNTIDYFLREREKTKETQLENPNLIFEKIYFYIQTSNLNYLRFEVKWVDLFIEEK